MKRIFLCIFLACASQIFSQINVNGNVKDANNKPLGGVRIVSEDRRVMYSDARGGFIFPNVLLNSVLTFEIPGFSKQDVAVDEAYSQNNMQVTLGISSRQLEEVACVSISAASETTHSKKIDKQTLEVNNYGQDIPFLLDQQPSVVATSDAGNGIGYTGIRVRGMDASRINVTINGIPVNDPESHDVYWVNMPDLVSSIQSIDFQRGVSTSTNGAAAFGASLNIKTNDFTPAATAKVDVSVGSFQTLKTSIKATTGLIKGKYFMEARLSKIGSAGYIDRASANLQSWYLGATYVGKKSLVKALAFSGKETTYQSWYGTPHCVLFGTESDKNDFADRNGLSAAARENLLNSGRTYNFYTYANQVDNYQQDNYQLHFNHQFNNRWLMNIAGHFTRGIGYFEEYREADLLGTYQIAPVVFQNDTVLNSDLVRRRWLDNGFVGAIYTLHYRGGRKFNMVFGGSANSYVGKHFGEVIWARFASDSDLGDRYYNESGRKNEWSNYLKAEYNWNRFKCIGDLQYRYVNYSFLGIDFVSGELKDVQQTVDFHFFNPKVSGFYNVSSAHKLAASFGISNREPVRRDFRESTPQSRPKAESLRDFEFGYTYQKRKIIANINLYYMDYDNQLALTGQVNDVGAYTRINLKDSHRKGIEIDVTYRPIAQLELRGNATFSQNIAKNYVDYTDVYLDSLPYFTQETQTYSRTKLALSPDFIGSFGATYTLKNTGLKFDWTTKYVGRQYLDNIQTSELAAFTYSNLGIRFTLKTKDKAIIECSAIAQNLFNALYASNGYAFSYISGGVKTTERFYYPQAGRNFMLRMTLSI